MAQGDGCLGEDHSALEADGLSRTAGELGAVLKEILRGLALLAEIDRHRIDVFDVGGKLGSDQLKGGAYFAADMGAVDDALDTERDDDTKDYRQQMPEKSFCCFSHIRYMLPKDNNLSRKNTYFCKLLFTNSYKAVYKSAL